MQELDRRGPRSAGGQCTPAQSEVIPLPPIPPASARLQRAQRGNPITLGSSTPFRDWTRAPRNPRRLPDLQELPDSTGIVSSAAAPLAAKHGEKTRPLQWRRDTQQAHLRLWLLTNERQTQWNEVSPTDLVPDGGVVGENVQLGQRPHRMMGAALQDVREDAAQSLGQTFEAGAAAAGALAAALAAPFDCTACADGDGGGWPRSK